VLLLAVAAPAFAVRTVMVVDEVIRMSKAGVGDAEIIAYVKKTPDMFEINGDDVIAMNDAHVSSAVMKFVIDESAARMKDARNDDRRSRETRTVYVRPMVSPYYYDPYYYGYYDPFWYGPRAYFGFGVGFGGRFGGGLQFFRITGRRHHRNQRDVAVRDYAHVRRQLDVADVLGMVDVELGNIDVDRFRDRLDRAHHLDGVGDDVDRAAALDAGRLVGIEHLDRDVDADDGAFRHAEEIHVHRQVFHRIELEVARDHAVLGAFHVDVKQRGEEAPGINALAQFGMVHQDQLRGLVFTIDHARHIAGATCSPSGPLAAFRTHRRLQFQDGRHVETLI
jgi:hypothetical protein